jgi:hypothetical protein
MSASHGYRDGDQSSLYSREVVHATLIASDLHFSTVDPQILFHKFDILKMNAQNLMLTTVHP